VNVDDIRQRNWDFGLTVLTVVLLGSLGVQSFLGTLYVWWAQQTFPGWEQVGYDAFVAVMNAVAAPQVVLLVVVMGLCVPKRLFSRRALIAVSSGMVALGVVTTVATSSLQSGLAVYLALAGLIQLAVVLLTAVGARGPSYLTEGRLAKLGSGLLHLGFIVFAIVVVAMQRSSFMIQVFWVSAVLVTGGTAMSFYASKLAVRRTIPVEHDIDF
jgi:hypothetical protein